ncbi:MAG: hypothetical protein SCK57_10445 [Bacillota bacterium]|nr:hypothetical protein [Bacillota bacterium]MDW7678068.1 hypothetical protein [Bacillota bacterium]
MSGESPKLFQCLIEKKCHDLLFDGLAAYIEAYPQKLELEEKSRSVQEVQAAVLDEMEIIRVDNIQQLEDGLHFDVIISCEIEIEETFKRDRQVDAVRQWFRTSCKGELEQLAESLKIHLIEVYQQPRRPL